ncbi:MAG: hypothetical protein RR957_05910, partial [Oscillospiraceae bacterium]
AIGDVNIVKKNIPGTNKAEPAKSTLDINEECALTAGETLYSLFEVEADGYGNLFNVTFTISDADNSDVSYNFMDVGKVFVPENTQKVYDAKEYTDMNTLEESPWGFYLSPGEGKPNETTVSGWGKFDTPNSSSPYKYDVKPNGNIEAIYEGKQMIFFPPRGSNNGTFEYKPNLWENADKPYSYSVVGWKAPHAGKWYVDIGVKNSGEGSNNGGESKHKLAYQKEGQTDITYIDKFNAPSSGTGKSAAMKYSLSLDANESLYLMNNATTDGWCIHTAISYRIINADDPSEFYDASRIGSTMLKGANGGMSPFTYVFSDGDIYNLDSIHVKNLHKEADRLWVSRITEAGTDKFETSFIEIKKAGNIAMKPEKNYSGGEIKNGNDKNGRTGIMFTAPEDGFYEMNLTVGTLGEPIGGAGTFGDLKCLPVGKFEATNVVDRFGITQATSENPNPAPTVVNKFMQLKKNERIIFSNGVHVDGYNVINGVNFTFKKLDKVSYNYDIAGAPVNNFNDVDMASGADKNLNVSCQYLNDTTGAVSVTALILIYDNMDTLVAQGVSTVTSVNAGEFGTLNASVKIPAGIGGGNVKTLIWDNMDNIKPMAKMNVLPAR